MTVETETTPSKYVCQSWTLVGAGEADWCIQGLPCKRWTCGDCVQLRLKELCDLAQAGRPTTLITLTCDSGQYDTPDEGARALVHSWRMIRQRLKREGIADNIQYLAVFERTRSGWPHLHILARCPFISQQYLSQLCEHFHKSPIVDIRKVYNQKHAAKYVAKYVSKGPGLFEGTKRYFRSQNWLIDSVDVAPVMDKGRDWHMVRRPPRQVAQELIEAGWFVEEGVGQRVMASPGSPPMMPAPDIVMDGGNYFRYLLWKRDQIP